MDRASLVQSVIFDRRQWNSTQAREWLRDHKLKSSVKVDRTPNKLRFRQIDPGFFDEFRMKTLKKNPDGSPSIQAVIGFVRRSQPVPIGKAVTIR